MWAGGGLLPVWTNFTLGLLHRRPRIESWRRQKNFDRAGIFQKQHHWDAISQPLGLQSATLPLCHTDLFSEIVVGIIIYFIFLRKSSNRICPPLKITFLSCYTICLAYDLTSWLLYVSSFVSILWLPVYFFFSFTTSMTHNIGTHTLPIPPPPYPTAKSVQIQSKNSFSAQKTKEA
jgi:hypothetical protein